MFTEPWRPFLGVGVGPGRFMRRVGVEAWEVIYENDQTWASSYLRKGEFLQMTPEQRYEQMLRWVRNRID